MKLTEAKLKKLILEMMDDDWGATNPVKKIAQGMAGDPESIENMLFLADSFDLDLSEIGPHLNDDAAWYIHSQITNDRPEWAQMLIKSKNPRILIWLLRDWKRNREILTDDQLIQMYKSGPQEFRKQMKKYKSLPPAVKQAIGEFRSTPSRLQTRLRRRKK